ncbi:aminopeptidase A. Metallo peptidase. MEROPS family M17 [Fontimonas thermophila]|uniref:Probable cytosol aminopeptidase n=1 Tax=Fontimonas thermophila TaxID=1076937 RepID=A0A1I2IS43_9GAMM|nr:leucyl aminopeptidase [Fontimonas thermophila]SFF44468.1 aminopeptidase A. Metallo peptidase. MEROPS family M17 [Fontimonas thermophila]
MDYSVKSGSPEKQRVGCVIVGIYDRRSPSPAAAVLDTASGGAISAVLRRGDMDGKLATTLVLHNIPGVLADRVMLVGLGRERSFDESAFRKTVAASSQALRATGAIDAVSYLTHLPVKGRDFRWNVTQAVLAAENVFYRFDECRGAKAREELPVYKLERYVFDVPRRADLPAGERGLTEALAIAKGVALTKNLGNLPGNICTPTYLAEQAKALATRYPIKTRILEQADMEKLGMGALLSVAKGSRQPPKLIVMEYLHGRKDQKPIALVGKGLTFDAGGISIKPAAGMDEMKFDMCGGGAVLGTMTAAAELKLPINLVGIVPAAENLPDGQANKPGDIVTSMAGITIEVLNTDAEGRLILCDALTYAEKTYAPEVCIDMATLTGACVVALGGVASGLMTNTPSLGRALLAAGEEIGDRAWELPLWPEYEENIKSEFADIANIATQNSRDAGAIIGAAFLHRFTRKMKWAHLDIAGTAWTGKKASGRPVPMLVQYLLNVVAQNEQD